MPSYLFLLTYFRIVLNCTFSLPEAVVINLETKEKKLCLTEYLWDSVLEPAKHLFLTGLPKDSIIQNRSHYGAKGKFLLLICNGWKLGSFHLKWRPETQKFKFLMDSLFCDIDEFLNGLVKRLELAILICKVDALIKTYDWVRSRNIVFPQPFFLEELGFDETIFQWCCKRGPDGLALLDLAADWSDAVVFRFCLSLIVPDRQVFCLLFPHLEIDGLRYEDPEAFLKDLSRNLYLSFPIERL